MLPRAALRSNLLLRRWPPSRSGQSFEACPQLLKRAQHVNSKLVQVARPSSENRLPEAALGVAWAMADLDPLNALAHRNRAIAYTFLGKDVKPRQDCERAVGLGLDRGRLEAGLEKAKRQRWG